MAYSTLASYLRQRNRGMILSLLLAAAFVYLPFLGNPFFFDDLHFFSQGVAERYSDRVFDFSLRWLPYASLGWTYAGFSDVLTHIYHLGNTLLHAATAIALFYFLQLLMTAFMPETRGSATVKRACWLAALIFAVHPVAVYAVGYVMQRSIVMATLFVLLMQMAYLQALLTGKRRWLVLTVLAYFCAVFSKEHSLLAPLLLLVETYVLRQRIKPGKIELGITWLAMAAIGLYIMLLSVGVFGVPYEIMAESLFAQQSVAVSRPVLHGLSILTQAGLYFKYLVLWMVPSPAWMSIDMREPFVASINDWRGWLGGLGFAGYGLFAMWLMLRQGWLKLAGLALLYPWLQFLVEFSSIRVQEPFVLYRSYLWMPGLLLLIPLFMHRFGGRKSILIMVIVILLLLSLSWNRLWVMADKYRLWNDAALLLESHSEPGAGRILYNRATAASPDKPQGEALCDLEQSAAMHPLLAPVRIALGYEYLNAKRYAEAMLQFDDAQLLDEKDVRIYYAKGLIYKRLGDDKNAFSYMRQSCELGDVIACFFVNRASQSR